MVAEAEQVMTEERTHLGIFYQVERPVYEDRIFNLTEQKPFDIQSYLQQFS